VKTLVLRELEIDIEMQFHFTLVAKERGDLGGGGGDKAFSHSEFVAFGK
jgi:hypothetical protein